jgi:hypothetical protein
MCALVHSYIHGWSTLLCIVRTLRHTLLRQLSVCFLQNSIHYLLVYNFIYCWYTILYIVREVVCTIVPGGIFISWRGFYVLTKLVFIHLDIKFYATSAPYLVERF